VPARGDEALVVEVAVELRFRQARAAASVLAVAATDAKHACTEVIVDEALLRPCPRQCSHRIGGLRRSRTWEGPPPVWRLTRPPPSRRCRLRSGLAGGP
jgi:hypothetical protein